MAYSQLLIGGLTLLSIWHNVGAAPPINNSAATHGQDCKPTHLNMLSQDRDTHDPSLHNTRLTVDIAYLSQPLPIDHLLMSITYALFVIGKSERPTAVFDSGEYTDTARHLPRLYFNNFQRQSTNGAFITGMKILVERTLVRQRFYALRFYFKLDGVRIGEGSITPLAYSETLDAGAPSPSTNQNDTTVKSVNAPVTYAHCYPLPHSPIAKDLALGVIIVVLAERALAGSQPTGPFSRRPFDNPVVLVLESPTGRMELFENSLVMHMLHTMANIMFDNESWENIRVIALTTEHDHEVAVGYLELLVPHPEGDAAIGTAVS